MFRNSKKTVRAQEFILEDAEGNERASLGKDNAGNTVLSFRDAAGAPRFYAGLTPDGTPRIGLTYAGGKGSIQLEANDTLGSAALTISGGSGRVQVVSAITSSGVPILALFDEDGKLIFSNVTPPEDDPDSEADGPFNWDNLGRI